MPLKTGKNFYSSSKQIDRSLAARCLFLDDGPMLRVSGQMFFRWMFRRAVDDLVIFSNHSYAVPMKYPIDQPPETNEQLSEHPHTKTRPHPRDTGHPHPRGTTRPHPRDSQHPHPREDGTGRPHPRSNTKALHQ